MSRENHRPTIENGEPAFKLRLTSMSLGGWLTAISFFCFQLPGNHIYAVTMFSEVRSIDLIAVARAPSPPDHPQSQLTALYHLFELPLLLQL